MADGRTFTEGEAYALVNDAVERETAEAKAKVAELEAQIVSLGNEKDALEVRASAAEEKAANAEKALDDYKAEVATEKAMEAKRAERLAKVAEVAPKLDITSEKEGAERANRIVAMADEMFDKYVDDIRQVASESKQDTEKGDESGALPRESAAFKGGPTGEGAQPTGSVKGVFGARAALATTKSA